MEGSNAKQIAALVRRASKGDGTALRALFDQFQRSVMSYCLLSANGDRDSAMDLTQETFSRAFTQLSSLREPERFRGWLFTIAQNVCRTMGAKNKRHQEALYALSLALEVEPSFEEQVERQERIAIVSRYLEGIADPMLKKIAQLKYTDPEHTTREIAKKLDIPHGTVTVKLMRFRAAVKRDLARMLLVEEVA